MKFSGLSSDKLSETITWDRHQKVILIDSLLINVSCPQINQIDPTRMNCTTINNRLVDSYYGIETRSIVSISLFRRLWRLNITEFRRVNKRNVRRINHLNFSRSIIWFAAKRLRRRTSCCPEIRISNLNSSGFSSLQDSRTFPATDFSETTRTLLLEKFSISSPQDVRSVLNIVFHIKIE